MRAGAMAAAAAQQDRLWPFADAFYRSQGAENSGYVTDDFLRGIGEATPGLDVERALRRPLAREGYGDAHRAERAAGARGRRPHADFYLRRGDGPPRAIEPEALTAETFTAALDEALAR